MMKEKFGMWVYYHSVNIAITISVLIALGVLFLLAGCVSPAVEYQKMTADQIRAAVADKNANVGCSAANGPWGRAVVTFTNIDKGIIPNGKLSVDDQCKVTIENAK